MSEAAESATSVADQPIISDAEPDETSGGFKFKLLSLCFFLGLVAAVAAVVIEIPYFSFEPGLSLIHI